MSGHQGTKQGNDKQKGEILIKIDKREEILLILK